MEVVCEFELVFEGVGVGLRIRLDVGEWGCVYRD